MLHKPFVSGIVLSYLVRITHINQEGYRHIRDVISEEMAFRGQEQDFFRYFRLRFFARRGSVVLLAGLKIAA